LAVALTTEINYRSGHMHLEDDQTGELRTQKDESAFEQVFKSCFKSLNSYAFTIVKDELEAEEIVQQVFFKLWERMEKVSIHGSLASYLYRAVHNESMNYLKHQKVKVSHRFHVSYSMKNQTENMQPDILNKELENKLREALNELPEQCRTIFQLSRFDKLRYAEIAGKLDISVKTVENQMGKALKRLRARLAEFLTLALISLLNL